MLIDAVNAVVAPRAVDAAWCGAQAGGTAVPPVPPVAAAPSPPSPPSPALPPLRPCPPLPPAPDLPAQPAMSPLLGHSPLRLWPTPVLRLTRHSGAKEIPAGQLLQVVAVGEGPWTIDLAGALVGALHLLLLLIVLTNRQPMFRSLDHQ